MELNNEIILLIRIKIYINYFNIIYNVLNIKIIYAAGNLIIIYTVS